MGIIQVIYDYMRMLAERPTIVLDTKTANWNSGVATSGLAGCDLFTYGVAGQWWRMQEAYFRLFPGIFNIAATITYRVYFTIIGAETLIGEDDVLANGTDGDIIPLYWFWINAEIYGPLRVELYSDTPADDGVTVPYEYRVKSW